MCASNCFYFDFLKEFLVFCISRLLDTFPFSNKISGLKDNSRNGHFFNRKWHDTFIGNQLQTFEFSFQLNLFCSLINSNLRKKDTAPLIKTNDNRVL